MLRSIHSENAKTQDDVDEALGNITTQGVLRKTILTYEMRQPRRSVTHGNEEMTGGGETHEIVGSDQHDDFENRVVPRYRCKLACSARRGGGVSAQVS